MNVSGARKPSDSVMRYASAAIGQPPGNVSAAKPNIANWVDQKLLEQFAAEGTDAHRLCTINDGWVERFGREILISFKNTSARDRLKKRLAAASNTFGIRSRRTVPSTLTKL